MVNEDVSFRLQSSKAGRYSRQEVGKSNSILRTSALNNSDCVMTRGFQSSLFCWLMMACSSRRIFSRRDEAEFPVAESGRGRTCSLLNFRGLRAQDCASTDALRPYKHRLNIQYQHELSLIRQTFAAFARRLPTKGRSPSASARCRGEAREKDILAADRCIFWKQRASPETGDGIPQRLAAATTGASSS